jgi:molybdopterin synthase catalytic subunit
MTFSIVRTPIDAGRVKHAVLGPGNGAVLVFHGAVRNKTADRRVTHLEYEAYEPMALAALETIGQEVVKQHGISAIACTHRIGRLEIGDDAMVVAVSSPHRAAALAALEDFIVRLKQDVPIWKKEHFEGGAVWIGTPENPQGGPSSFPPEPS